MMRGIAAKGVNSPQASSAHRDKRYTIPALSVDLFATVFEALRWSFSHMILKEYQGPLTVGATLHGAFTFPNRTTVGLFEASVARADTGKQLLGVEFTWISKEGFALLEYMHSLRPEDNPDKGDPMRVTMNYPTINWSLSGMLLGEYDLPNSVKSENQVRGIIRTEKSQESGIFTAKIVRASAARRSLALTFTSLSSELFDMLETAIKKHPPLPEV
jgi:hypothetical protein